MGLLTCAGLAPTSGVVRRGVLASGGPFTARAPRGAACRRPFLGARTAVPGMPSIPDLATGPNGAVTIAAASPPALVLAPDTVNINAVLPPAAIYQEVVKLGEYKAGQPWWKTFIAGVMAGVFVSLSGMLLLTVGPNCVEMAGANPGLAKYVTGAIGFPYGLLMILTCGGELFTGNTAVVTAAVYEGRASLAGLAKSWISSYAGNFVGTLLGVGLAVAAGLLPNISRGATAFAVYKTGAPLGVTLARAVAANWFVCMAVWQCTAAKTFGGKFIACLGPVSAFVTIGLEHCIANMFFIPLGILAGADTNVRAFFLNNLIPVTLGNIFAGVVCVATVYSLLYGSLGKKIAGAPAGAA